MFPSQETDDDSSFLDESFVLLENLYGRVTTWLIKIIVGDLGSLLLKLVCILYQVHEYIRL